MREQIGPYHIQREVGRGGMGVVYLARDTRLDRDVAIKALPVEVASDPARLDRFEREARTLAGLSHPNLAGIYGVEEQDGAKYLVLEYVDGETLADRLDRGPLSIEDALELAVQIAAGIEAAHEAGVIHRDLKPANIKITPDGQAKVLDFGLARADDGSISSVGGLDSPTITTPQNSPTIEGAILGTAAYMSPEQARGRRVDKRTDIWSFGVVLYEMLSGASPFHGETASDSIGAVLHKDLDLAHLPPHTPSHVRRVLSRCLERDKNTRYRDIGDVRIELLRSASTDVAVGSSRRSLALPLLLPVVLIAAALAWWLKPAPQPEPRPIVHATISIPTEMSVTGWPFPKLSADGQRMVFGVVDGGEVSAAVRDLNTPEVRLITGTSEAYDLCLSPDGRWLAYEDGATIKKRLIEGGPAIKVCDAPSARGILWSLDDEIITAPERFGPLHIVDATGGVPTPLYEMDMEERFSDRHPSLLPDGQGVLFHRTEGDAATGDFSMLMVARFDGTPPRMLVNGGRHGRYVNSGHLVYQQGTSLFAVGFDLENLEITTPEYVVLEGISATAFVGAPAQFDISPNGTLLYFSGDATLLERQIVELDFDGVTTPLTEHTGTFEEIVPSDDGRFIAIELNQVAGADRLQVIELERDLLIPVPTSNTSGDYNPIWSPDNRWIVFTSSRDLPSNIPQLHRYRVGSAAPPQLLIRSTTYSEPTDWSSDGRSLLVRYTPEEGSFPDLGVVRFDESGEVVSKSIEPLIEWEGNQRRALFSPDDQWFVFTSYTTLTDSQIFVVNINDPTISAQISVGSGNFATWAPDKDSIYYLDDNSTKKTVFEVAYTITDAGDFIPSPPKALFDLQGVVEDIDSFYTNADGTAFVIGVPVNAPTESERRLPNLILNWDVFLSETIPLNESN